MLMPNKIVFTNRNQNDASAIVKPTKYEKTWPFD